MLDVLPPNIKQSFILTWQELIIAAVIQTSQLKIPA